LLDGPEDYSDVGSTARPSSFSVASVDDDNNAKLSTSLLISPGKTLKSVDDGMAPVVTKQTEWSEKLLEAPLAGDVEDRND